MSMRNKVQTLHMNIPYTAMFTRHKCLVVNGAWRSSLNMDISTGYTIVDFTEEFETIHQKGMYLDIIL